MEMVNNLVKTNYQKNSGFTKEELINLSKEELIEKVYEIEEQKKIQEDFILNISHDLRSPLNIILSILQCYKFEYVGDGKEKIQEHMDTIKRNCYKMLKLINNLIDTTKLDRDYYNLKKENLDIINLIEWNISNIDKYASQKNISLIFDTNVEECIIAIDPEATDRIIMNLLSNAVKFSPEDSNVYINVWKRNDKIKISVRDEGVGIPLEEQDSIFDRFIQSSKNKKSEDSGSGIGLDLVKRLVNAHGGTISLNSKENEGSEFVIDLPLTLVSNSDSIQSKKLDATNKVDVLEIEFSDIYL